jgi:hypothetical protein
MSGQQPPKHQPLNFETPLVGEGGKMHEGWQRQMTALVQRVEAPVATIAPGEPAAGTGRPGQIQTDGSFLYVNIGEGTWKKATLA